MKTEEYLERLQKAEASVLEAFHGLRDAVYTMGSCLSALDKVEDKTEEQEQMLAIAKELKEMVSASYLEVHDIHEDFSRTTIGTERAGRVHQLEVYKRWAKK